MSDTIQTNQPAFELLHKPAGEKSRWTLVGVMFPRKDGKPGFNVRLNYMPVNSDGWFTALPPKAKTEGQ